jgi:hypothetical protein
MAHEEQGFEITLFYIISCIYDPTMDIFLIIVGKFNSHENHCITSVAIGDKSGSSLWQYCYSSNKTWTYKWFIIFRKYQQCDEIYLPTIIKKISIVGS